MSQLGKDNKHHSFEDFERYYSGKMTEQEMYALEKAALDDPFLSDALEGYLYTKSASADINALEIKLLQKTGGKTIWYKRKTISTLLKVAAFLVFFAGFGWLLYTNNLKQNEIASVIEDNNGPVIPETAVSKTTDSLITKKTEATISIAPADETKQQQTLALQKNEPNDPTGNKEIIIASGAATYTVDQRRAAVINDSVSNSHTDFYNKNIQLESANNNIDNAIAGKQSGVQLITPKKIRGRITDSKGNPVSFANVIDKKNNRGVQSDSEGSFALTSLDSAPKVEINAIGYQAITKALSYDSMSNNLVLLEQNNTLKEVVVTKSSQTKRIQRSKSSPVTSEYTYKDEKNQRARITNATPLNGWQDFNKYIIDSLKTLEQLGSGSVSAEILVSFDVNNTGEPVNIHVNKSLCNACNEEAIRIIKNGPVWKLNKKRKKAIAVVKF